MILQLSRTSLLNIEDFYRAEGRSRPEARQELARKLKVGVGTVENLIRNRVKSIRADLAAAIMALRVKTIEAEIARLTRERDAALRSYAAVDASKVAAMEECLSQMRALVSETRNR